MTAALAAVVDTLELPAEPGVSVRTCRTVLRTLARLADTNGEFRWGTRVAKLAALCELSNSTIKRAQRYLVRLGLLERAEVGGGRASTRWRILVDALAEQPTSPTAPRTRPVEPPSSRPGWRAPMARQRGHRGPGLDPRSLTRRVARAVVGAGRSGMSPPVEKLCEHGHDADLLPSGLPRCPVCRRYLATTASGGLRR